MNKTFSIKTLGCKLNQYESSEIAGEFTGKGWEMRPFGEDVDITIINTCTVTDATDKKCRAYIRQGIKKSTSGRVIVTGCMADSSGNEPGIDPSVSMVLGNREKRKVYTSALKLLGKKDVIKNDSSEFSKPLPVNRSRASIKIQDGCDNHCSYCIVPSVRGEPESRNLDEIIEHAEKLISEGYHELVLTGITTGKYKYKDCDFPRLVERLINLDGDYRIRITSIEPVDVTEKLLGLYGSEKLCSHIHLPLQSGSDRILRLMNRKYSSADFMKIIEKIKILYPNMAIGTDLIVGFPGEDENDFMDSISMIKEAGFAYTHCFTFSRRKGTPASEMKENAGPGIISERVKKAKVTAALIGEDYRKMFIDRTLKSVVSYKEKSDNYTAVTDNYIKVKLENRSLPPGILGCFQDVKILRVDSKDTYGIVSPI